MSAELAEKHERLKAELERLGSTVLAYSGGVDSTLVLAVGLDVLGDKIAPVLAVSATYPDTELEQARRYASELDVDLQVIESDELDDPRFVANPPERCRYCKQDLMARLHAIRKERGFAFVADGANIDDLDDYRPGREAAEEAGVVSPLLAAGLTKEDVRALSEELGLPDPQRPAMACLASRIPYGTELTSERLGMVAKAEEGLAAAGFAGARVRHHGDVARIEVAPDDLPRALQARQELAQAVHGAGFAYVALDLDGYRSGSLNTVLGKSPDDGS